MNKEEILKRCFDAHFPHTHYELSDLKVYKNIVFDAMEEYANQKQVSDDGIEVPIENIYKGVYKELAYEDFAE